MFFISECLLSCYLELVIRYEPLSRTKRLRQLGFLLLLTLPHLLRLYYPRLFVLLFERRTMSGDHLCHRIILTISPLPWQNRTNDRYRWFKLWWCDTSVVERACDCDRFILPLRSVNIPDSHFKTLWLNLVGWELFSVPGYLFLNGSDTFTDKQLPKDIWGSGSDSFEGSNTEKSRCFTYIDVRNFPSLLYP